MFVEGNVGKICFFLPSHPAVTKKTTKIFVSPRKTLLSSDGGATFSELAAFPEDLEETCGVFLSDTEFMVIGGRFVQGSNQEKTSVWVYDIPGDTWTAGTTLPAKRSQHIWGAIQ